MPADIQDGGRVFQNTCANCHGPDGDGIAGIDLGRGQFRRTMTDQDLVQIIRNGIPGTPPLNQVPNTCPNSWTAYMPIHEPSRLEPINTIWLSRCRVTPVDPSFAVHSLWNLNHR